MRSYCVILAILLAHASVVTAFAAAQTDRVAVSAVVEGGCTLAVAPLLARVRAGGTGNAACAPIRGRVPAQPLVTLVPAADAQGAMLLVEF